MAGLVLRLLSTWLLLGSAVALVGAPTVSADCDNTVYSCPLSCPRTQASAAGSLQSGPCSHRQARLDAVVDGRSFTATLVGGRAVSAALNATSESITFDAGHPMTLDFKVSDLDGNDATNRTVRVNITVQDLRAGTAHWTSVRYFEDIHMSPGGFQQSTPRFTLEAGLGLQELRFLIRTEEWDEKGRGLEQWRPAKYVEMGFLVDVLPSTNTLASPAGLTPILILAFGLMAGAQRRR